MTAYCNAYSNPVLVPHKVCACGKPPCLISGTGIDPEVAKLCRNCHTEPFPDGTQDESRQLCMLKGGHRGRHSWAR